MICLWGVPVSLPVLASEWMKIFKNFLLISFILCIYIFESGP